MSKKFIAAAVVAIFCVTAFASVAGESDAAKQQDYILYIEEQTIVAGVPVIEYGFVYFKAEPELEPYVEAANAALAASEFSNLSCKVQNLGIWWTCETTTNLGSWVSDGTAWSSAKTTSYVGAAKTCVVIGGYISTDVYNNLDEAYKDMYYDTEYPGDWQYLLKPAATPQVMPMQKYITYLTIIENDLVSWEATAVTFTAEKEPYAWCYAFNQAIKALGNSIFAGCEVNYTAEFNYIGVTFNDSFNNATWVKDGKNWVAANVTGSEYVNADEIDFELKNGWIDEDQYKALDAKEQKNWTYNDGMASYMRNATGEVVEEAISMMLIIGIVGALILAVIIAIVLIMVVRKKSGNKTA